MLTLSKSASRFDKVGALIAGCRAMRKCSNTLNNSAMVDCI